MSCFSELIEQWLQNRLFCLSHTVGTGNCVLGSVAPLIAQDCNIISKFYMHCHLEIVGNFPGNLTK